MICAHGLSEETCPHCAMQMRIRPSQRLVELMPTELPMDLPPSTQMKKDLPVTADLIQPVQGSKIVPLGVSRTFNIREKFFAPQNSLLDQRLQAIETRYGDKTIPSDEKLFDLKKKFLK